MILNNYNFPTLFKNIILLDSGPLFSLAKADHNDTSYNNAKNILNKIKLNKINLLITNVTIFESYTRILYDLGWNKAISFLKDLEQSDLAVERITEEDELEAKNILNKYKFAKISFVDALNFAVMKRKKFLYAFTFDKDFLIVGFQMFN